MTGQEPKWSTLSQPVSKEGHIQSRFAIKSNKCIWNQRLSPEDYVLYCNALPIFISKWTTTVKGGDIFIKGLMSNMVRDISNLSCTAFPFFSGLCPWGSEYFGPRRLLTHRCYSNTGRKSCLNITSDPVCQLIQCHPFWNRLSTSINYQIFPPSLSIHFIWLQPFSNADLAVS